MSDIISDSLQLERVSSLVMSFFALAALLMAGAAAACTPAADNAAPVATPTVTELCLQAKRAARQLAERERAPEHDHRQRGEPRRRQPAGRLGRSC